MIMPPEYTMMILTIMMAQNITMTTTLMTMIMILILISADVVVQGNSEISLI